MTETEWLASNDPGRMVDCVRNKASDRKMRLFAVACCHRVWELIPDERCKEAVVIAERCSDEAERKALLRQTSEQLSSLIGTLSIFGGEVGEYAAIACQRASCPANVHMTFEAAAVARGVHDSYDFWQQARNVEHTGQAVILRDIFGNPFRPVAVDPRWLTSAVVGVAEGIYADRAFDRLPILADALQDAGCEDADILGHCCSEGPHVRGCWAVDLVLGKN